ncbi:hypothetical protein H0R90_03340 [Treponema putidum]|uniref:hypothetical protein n=1 Tax=Treponema putidum TaxID=221027 RepID=UPI0004F6F19B|nr:hypothetical protein [Treponema putidum]AIN94472.1 hypothetical protein JO40_10545 [Treponema putidum]TWI78935.1 hypothetical protein JM98_00520 [Treponema putidum]
MKHKKFIFFGILILIILASCKQGFVKKVKIKAAPQVKVNLGSKEINVGNIVYENISETLKNNENVKIYKYTPKDNQGNALHYLFHYAVPEKEIDMTDYAEKINSIPSKQEITILKNSVTIPTINISHTTGPLKSIQNTNGSDLSMNNEKIDISPEISIQLTTPNLSYADIEKGILEITLGSIDDILKEKLTINYEHVQINQESQLSGNFEKKNNLTGELNLKDKRITNNTIKISGYVEISGTIPADYTQVINLKLKVSSNIEKFKEIKITNQTITPNINETINIPNEIKDYVEEITLDPILIKANITNKLPADVGIKLESEALNIHQTEFTQFKANHTNDKPQEKDIFKGKSTLMLNATPSLDIKVKIKIAGYDDSNQTLTLYNITPGSEYSFEGKVNVNFELEKAIIKPIGTNLKIDNEYTINTDILKNNEILSRISPKPINAYIYLVSDLSGNGAPAPFLTTKLELEYGSTKKEIINKNNEKTQFVADPTFNNNIPKASIEQSSIDLENVFESKPEAFKFKIDMSLNKLTLTKDVINKIKKDKKAEFKAHALLDIPMAVTINDNICKEVLSINDLLSRQSGETIAGPSSQVLDSIKELNLIIEYTNNTGLTLDARIYNPEWKDGSIFKFEKKLKLKEKRPMSINLSKEEIEDIKRSSKFPIVIEVTIPKDSEINIKNGTLNFSAYTVANMDITYEF